MQWRNKVRWTQEMAAPEIGMGATVLHWTDRSAHTIIAVSPSGKTITLQEDHRRRTDALGMTDSGQQYEFTPNPNGATSVARLGKHGWRIGGQRGLKVLVGVRDAYHDYSF